MPDVEDRVSDIEKILMKLAYMQMNTQMNLDKLSQEMSEFKEEIRKDTKELKKDTRELKNELKEFKDEMKQDRKELNRKWGDLASKWGTIMEDMVVPNIKTISEAYFDCKKEECYVFAIRFEKVSSKDKKKKREFDIIAVYPDKLVVNETKASPKQDYIDKFISDLADFYDYFPEYESKEIIPVFASLYIPEHILLHLSRNKIYAMAMKEDTMDILNPDCRK